MFPQCFKAKVLARVQQQSGTLYTEYVTKPITQLITLWLLAFFKDLDVVVRVLFLLV